MLTSQHQRHVNVSKLRSKAYDISTQAIKSQT